MVDQIRSGNQQWDELDTSARVRRPRTDTVVFGVVMALVVLTMVGAGLARRGNAGVTQVKPVLMAGDSELFDDADAQAELARNGLRVDQTPMGSLRVANEPNLADRFDVADVGSADAAEKVIKKLAEKGVTGYQSSPLSTPMVIITYPAIASVLQKLCSASDPRRCVAAQRPNGTWAFDMSVYLEKVAAKTRWNEIPENSSYRSQNRVLISTTDPTQSNSGGMLLAIESLVENDGVPVPLNQAKDPNWLNGPQFKLIRSTFEDLGNKPTHTDLLLTGFLSSGMSKYPMALFYEKDYINTKLTHNSELLKTVVMYPNPTVTAGNTFVWWARPDTGLKPGKDLTDLLAKDRTLIGLAEKHGYRVSVDNATFVAEMHRKGIDIADLDDAQTGVTVGDQPTEDSLDAMIQAIGQ